MINPSFIDGSSGVGKSTLLDLLGIDPIVIVPDFSYREKIGILPLSQGCLDTIFKYISTNGLSMEIYDRSPISRLTEYILELVIINHSLYHTYISSLSELDKSLRKEIPYQIEYYLDLYSDRFTNWIDSYDTTLYIITEPLHDNYDKIPEGRFHKHYYNLIMILDRYHIRFDRYWILDLYNYVYDLILTKIRSPNLDPVLITRTGFTKLLRMDK